MFIVTLINDNVETEVHGYKQKLSSGKITKGINSIDSFSFTLRPSNSGFNRLYDFTTRVKVFNTAKNRYEFYGRVLYSSVEMSEDGSIKKDVVCESYFGFLCDSQQLYANTQNWTVSGLLTHIITQHNSQVEAYKRFEVGEITVTDPNDNLYLGIQRENTWKAITSKLLDKLGGEIRFRVVDDVIYIDYLTKIGDTKATKIALSKNMKSIMREKDPSEYITRLIPLGAKIDGEERLTVEAVNNGSIYIDDTDSINAYGVHVGYVEFDNVTTAQTLYNKAVAWLYDNNKVRVKYSITALDLSLLGLDIDDFDVYNYYPIENPLLDINDTARIIKKNIDICEEVKSTIEIGETFKTLSDIQREQATNILEKIQSSIAEVEQKTDVKLREERTATESLIAQNNESILASVSESYQSKEGQEEYSKEVETQLALLKNEILMKFTTTENQIIEVDDNLQSKFTEIYQYISFAGGSIKLGASDSTTTLTLDNEAIKFTVNGVTLGEWTPQGFYTGNVIIRLDERFQIGNFAYIPRSDGSVMLLKVSG